MLEKMIKHGGDWGFATPAGYACLSFRDGKIHTVSIDGQSFVEVEAAQDEITRLRERVAEPAAWLVERERDPTFPVAVTSKDHAEAIARTVKLHPLATIQPLYASHRPDELNRLRERVSELEKDAQKKVGSTEQ